MFKPSLLMGSALLATTLSVSAQTVLFEVQASVTEESSPTIFRVIGDKDEQALTPYRIQVVAPDGHSQLLEDFEAILPLNSEADALVIEDVNFDGYADLRLMEYLPGGANVPFFYWLYQPSSGTFEPSEAFQAVLSPQIDQENRQLLSRQRLSAQEYVIEYYDPEGSFPNLVRKEVRTYAEDGSSKIHIFTIKDGGVPELVETRQMEPEKP